MRGRLGLILLLGLAARLGAGALSGLGAPLEDDAMMYDALAVNLANGEGYSHGGQPITFRPPLVPALLAGLYAVAGHSLAAARVLLSVVNSLVVLPLHALGRRFGDERSGLLAAAIGAFYPHHVYYSSQVLTDAPAALAVTAATLLTLRSASEPGSPVAVAAGCVWGLATLTRYPLLVLVPLAAAWILWRARRPFPAIARVLLFAAGFALSVAPWVLRNHAVFGAWILTSPKGGLSLYIANHEGATGILSVDLGQVPTEDELARMGMGDERRVGDHYRARAIEFIRDSPGTFLRLCGVRLLQFWKIWSPRVTLAQNAASLVSFGGVLVFSLAGLPAHLRRRPETLLILAFIAVVSLVHAVYPAIVRYRLPIEPLVIALAAAPLLESLRRLLGRWSRAV